MVIRIIVIISGRQASACIDSDLFDYKNEQLHLTEARFRGINQRTTLFFAQSSQLKQSPPPRFSN